MEIGLSEDDQMIRAIAMSLGENVTEDAAKAESAEPPKEVSNSTRINVIPSKVA